MRLILFALLLGCHAQPGEPSSQSPPEQVGGTPVPAPTTSDAGPVAVPPSKTVAFPFDSLRSYAGESLNAPALDAYRRRELDRAAQLLAKAEFSLPNRILLAHVEERRGNWRQAASLYGAAAEEHAVIRDYLSFRAARAYGRVGQAEAAMTHAAAVSDESPWARERNFLAAESHRSAGRFDEAAEAYRAFLEGEPERELRSEALYRLQEMLEAKGDAAAALAIRRQLAVDDPLAPWLSESQRRFQTPLSSDELYRRGLAYYGAHRNLDAARDMKAVADASDITEGRRCEARYHEARSVFKERDYKPASKLLGQAVTLCHEAGNRDLEVKAAYTAGKAYSRLKKHERALDYYRRAGQYPEHSYADDARIRQAEELDDLGRAEEVAPLLSTLPEDVPGGDMHSLAMWRLARRAYQGKRYAEAVRWLLRQIEVAPVETKWWAEGQAEYWLGRSYQRLGEMEKAREAFVWCVQRYPLTYYSMQAINRHRELWPERGEELAAAMANGAPPVLELAPRELYGEARFASALELARLGLREAARRELDALGFEPPAGRQAISDDERADWYQAGMLLYDLAGDYERSHWLGRWHLVDYRRRWPAGDDARRWRLAYPMAYGELIAEFAGKHSYPVNLQMAIMREESAFDAARESWANAIGLTQMIFPTARDHSKGTGIAVTRENLQHPVKNVTIGSNFLQSLQDAFEGRVGLMVPGYNAGRARVRGWIRSRHRMDLDEFIEAIPGDQARRYTKRVLGSFAVYSYLAEGVVPTVQNQVPRRLGRRP